MTLEKKIILFKKARPNAIVPKYANSFAAGFDLHVSTFFDNDGKELTQDYYQLYVGDYISLGLGICTAIDPSKYVQVSLRSGIGRKHGISMVTGVGVIDPDYRGEWISVVRNGGMNTYTFRISDRICQGVLLDRQRAFFTESNFLPLSERGNKGFGSTGS